MDNNIIRHLFTLLPEIKAQQKILEKCGNIFPEEKYLHNNDYKDFIFVINVLEICLEGLTERERYIINNHLINDNPWENVEKKFCQEWGGNDSRSTRTLKRIEQQALMKIICVIKQAGAEKKIDDWIKKMYNQEKK